MIGVVARSTGEDILIVVIRTVLSVFIAILPVASELQTSVFDPSGDINITALRADPRGDLVIAGHANGPGLPLVNAFQDRFASSGMRRTHDGGRTWQLGERPTDYFDRLVVDPKDANT